MKGLKIFLQKKYFGVALPFIINSLMMSTWLLYTPYILDRLMITEAALGYAFFCMALGAVSSLAISKKLIKYYGEGRYTFFSTFGYVLLIICTVVAPNLPLLCLILFFTGAFAGSMDVGMNALATHLERKNQVRIMSACHGFWSLGFFVGASIGSVLMSYLMHPFVHMFLMMCMAMILHLYFSGPLRGEKSELEETEHKGGLSIFQNKKLVSFAIVGLVVMMTEGAIMDWSTLFMSRSVLAPEIWWGYALGIFSLCMAAGRFMMDPISDTYGSKLIVQGGLIVVVLGVLLVLSNDLMPVLFGFGLIGFGVSGIVPEIYRLSSQINGIESSDGVATVAGMGYIGFLAGPVLMGYLVENFAYSAIFYVILILVAIAFAQSKLVFRSAPLQIAEQSESNEILP
jgi:MFS family permease